ncbi:MAG: molybdopterin-guanine dinucleotide biosynthesis protein B [Candidatus Njordarchaeales archaeon]
MRPVIIAILGHKNSGKTTLIEYLTRELVNKGLKVVTMKHIHHDFFEVDKEGKDTWRHKRAGATIVSGVSKKRLVIISDEVSELNDAFEEVMNYLKAKNPDVILLEGFLPIVGSRKDIMKVVIARSVDEAKFFLQNIREGLLGIIKRESFTTNDLNIPILTEQKLLETILKIWEA